MLCLPCTFHVIPSTHLVVIVPIPLRCNVILLVILTYIIIWGVVEHLEEINFKVKVFYVSVFYLFSIKFIGLDVYFGVYLDVYLRYIKCDNTYKGITF